MKATCPKNKEHKTFVTVVHIAVDQIVDETGSYVDSCPNNEGEIAQGPHPQNTWTCNECGEEAEVEI